MKKGKLGAILLALVLIIGLVCCVVCLEKIPAGYVGVVYNMNGGVDGEVLEQGWHLVAPTKKVTKYSIGIEQSYLTADIRNGCDNTQSSPLPFESLHPCSIRRPSFAGSYSVQRGNHIRPAHLSTAP